MLIEVMVSLAFFEFNCENMSMHYVSSFQNFLLDIRMLTDINYAIGQFFSIDLNKYWAH